MNLFLLSLEQLEKCIGKGWFKDTLSNASQLGHLIDSKCVLCLLTFILNLAVDCTRLLF